MRIFSCFSFSCSLLRCVRIFLRSFFVKNTGIAGVALDSPKNYNDDVIINREETENYQKCSNDSFDQIPLKKIIKTVNLEKELEKPQYL